MKQQTMSSSLLVLDDDSLEHVLSFLDPSSLYSVSKCNKRLRFSVTAYLGRFPAKRYPIRWDYGKMEIARRGVTLERQDRDPVMKRNRTNYISVLPTHTFSFDEFDEMLALFVPAFKIFHLRAARLTAKILEEIDCKKLKDCAKGNDQTLLFDVDLNDLCASQIGTFLSILSPVALHFYGLFDRTVITGDAIPPSVQNIYVTENPISAKDPAIGSCLDFAFFQRILTSWKETTDAGLILPRTEWHDPLVKFIGNHRSIYVDHCRLTVEEVRAMWKIAYSRFGINQTIRFFNVRKRELLALNHEIPRVRDGENQLLPSLQAEMDHVQLTTGKTDLSIRFENGADNEGSRMAIFDHISLNNWNPFNSEQTTYMSCHLVMNQFPQRIKSLLPQVIHNSERYTIVRRNPRRTD